MVTLTEAPTVEPRRPAAVRGLSLQSGYKIALWVYAITFYVFLYGPLAMIVVLSFNDSGIIGFPIRGFTTRWYGVAVHNPDFLSAFGNSLGVGALTAVIATTLALLLAMGFRHAFPGKGAVLNLIFVPIIIPGIIGGILLLIFFSFLNIQSSLWTTVLVAHVNWALPFAFLTLYPRLHNFDRTLEEAAMDLGARPWTIFVRILLPIIKPGLIASALFSFTLSFDEFIRTVFVIGFERTIPVQFWSMIVDEVRPELPAVAVLIIAFSAVVALIGFVFAARGLQSAPDR